MLNSIVKINDNKYEIIMINKQNIEKKMIVDAEQYKKIKSLKKKISF